MERHGHSVMLRSVASSTALCGSGEQAMRGSGMWRRASAILREGVSAGWECVKAVDGINVDAIITATGLGCLDDSMTFLRSALVQGEEVVSAAPFIQSTFNAVAAQLALLLGCSGYNMSYVGRCHAFEDALLDGWMRIRGGQSHAVLVGAYEESTPLIHRLSTLLFSDSDNGEEKQWSGGGSIFCLLTADGTEGVEIAGVHFPERELTADEVRIRYGTPQSSVAINDWRESGHLYPTVSALSLCDFWSSRASLPSARNEHCLLYSHYHGSSGAVIHLRSI